MIGRKKVIIKHDKGIHTRVAAIVVHKASELQKKYNVKFDIIYKDKYKVTIASLIMLISLKIKKGDEIILETIGDNVDQALEEMCAFLEGDFDIEDKKDINQIDNIINENAITLEQIVNSMANGVIAIDEHEKITVFNTTAERILNIKSEKVLGKDIKVAIPDAKLSFIKNIKQYEIGRKIKIGNATVIASRSPIVIDNEFKGAVSIFEDISTVENITEELIKVKELKKQLQLVLESVQEGICVINKDGYINYVNPAYLRIVGVKKEDIINKPINSISPCGARSKSLVSGEKIRGAISKKNNGTTIVSNVSPIIIDGDVYGAVSVVKNITEIQELHKKLNEISDKAEYLEGELLRTKKNYEGFEKFKGRSGKVIDALAIASKAAKVDATVLIRGESGTGKELIAEGIHYISKNSSGPFIRVNCAAIPETLIESELFGHEKGAFTGAVKRKLGKFELSNNGTIFLDEIGELEKSMQAKILRVIQSKEIQRLGGEETIKVNVRIIAATHRNLEDMVKKNEFREDLYYRLNVIPIMLPPLRDRKEDIPLLVEYFFNKLKKDKTIKGIKREVMSILTNYSWPGNVRELENVIERIITLMEEDEYIKVEDLPFYIREVNTNTKYKDDLIEQKIETTKNIIDSIEQEEILPFSEYEKIIIEKALKKYKSYNAAGKALGITHKTVAAKAKKYGIEKIILWEK